MVRYESPSEYIPAGASFNGSGFQGTEALFDKAGAGWASALKGLEVPWHFLESLVHVREVDGDEVWGFQWGPQLAADWAEKVREEARESRLECPPPDVEGLILSRQDEDFGY